MRISDWSSDVCSSDLTLGPCRSPGFVIDGTTDKTGVRNGGKSCRFNAKQDHNAYMNAPTLPRSLRKAPPLPKQLDARLASDFSGLLHEQKTELLMEIGRATSELQSLMRISYAVFCLKKKNNNKDN